MGFDKIEAVSLTDQFVQKIESMIISGELMPGDQLPPARELSVKMGVSRTVISAGLVELEKLGFVEIRTRQGVFVCDYRRKGSLETLIAIMRYNGGAMRKNEVKSLLETRDAMECLCLRLVCEKNDVTEHLWSLYCKRSGVKKLYEIKLALFSALMNKDIDSAIEQTHRIMDVAKNDLGFYGA